MGDDTTDNNREMIANFAPSDRRCTLSSMVEPASGGSVRFDPAQTSGDYPVNTSVAVRAVTQTGYVFSRWMGDLAGSENPRTLRASEDKSIVAIFNPTVTVYCSPSEGGSVDPTPSPNGYAARTVVNLRATPAKGYRFVSWEGDASGSDRSISVVLDAPKTITGRFVEQSSSRWWLWVIVGVVALFCGLVLVRVVNARMDGGVQDEPPEFDG